MEALDEVIKEGSLSLVICPTCGTQFKATAISQPNESAAVPNDVQVESEEFLSSARRIAFTREVEEITHDHKNELFNLLEALKAIERSSPAKRSQIIQENIVRIRARIRDISANYGERKSSRINFNSIIWNMTGYFNKQLKGRNINISVACESDLPIIIADESEIKEVIFNLISNAVKAVQKVGRKQGEIIIGTNIVEERDIKYIQVSVQDNGIGIRREDGQSIYEKGFTTFEGSAGMGLFITRKIVNEHRGKIKFTSTVNKGTKFSVVIPLEGNRA